MEFLYSVQLNTTLRMLFDEDNVPFCNLTLANQLCHGCLSKILHSSLYFQAWVIDDVYATIEC